MTNQPLTTNSKEKPSAKFTRARVMYFIFALLFLIFAAGSWEIYNWQHQKVENLNSSLSSANKKANASALALASESKSNASLQAKYQDTLDELKAATTATSANAPTPTQEDLGLTVDNAVTANITSDGISVVAVNITLTNSTDSTIAVSPTAYEVKMQMAISTT